ncbi:DNA repair protein RecN [Microlunatus parietis]|uniref:DNA repair protein RecN n=1 Tax=Microlunatus parietis TaxID=682979 RepID=A0A7Y9I3N7_9ACTN|nr:DNA repair protein RecN [Microlunatus parietis]NYE69624.1 DNA repair protein RecN (Recombination protein N) [Microlunatus parietis]
MISELRITNLGVINSATIELDPGLTVVTGETGAGKTMIVTGMGLLLGARSDPKAVRTGAGQARVEGAFTAPDRTTRARVDELGGELDGDELLVARQVTSAGRSRSWVGGAQVPVGSGSAVVEELITIHGQSEQLRLTSPDRQRELLDAYAGDSVSESLDGYRQRYAERQQARAELAELTEQAQSRAREIDLLRFGLAEIEKIDPQPGEDVELAAEATRLQRSDDLRQSAAAAMVALAGGEDEAGGAMSAIAAARKEIETLAATDPDAEKLRSRVQDLSYALTELTSSAADYLDGLDAEPGRLEQIAERRSELATLTRKYGSDCDEVLAWAAEAASRLGGLESGDERIDELTARIAGLDGELAELAGRIGAARREAAASFATLVEAELAALAMPHARLSFAVTETELGPHGADAVELLFSANPGSEPRGLGKVASGGELSRVRLAIEVILAAESGNRGTFVFDEVDAGVGGKVAVEIGRRLSALARRAQVVVVTHLAQVAAFGDRHYVVVKADDGQVTTSGVQRVADDQRAAELARMMAGLDTTDSALAHARELIETADRARTAKPVRARRKKPAKAG